MTIIDITTYYPSQNPDFKGNPLIELLPPLDDLKIARALTSLPPCTEEDRTAAPETRLQYVNRLFDLFVPTPPQLEAAIAIWNAICQSYVRRAPPHVRPTATFQAMCAAFDANERLPADVTQLTELPHCIAIVGTPGCGKTQVYKRLLRRLCQDSIFRHLHHDFMYQLLYVWVEAGTTKTDKALAETIYERLYQAVRAAGSKRARVKGSARKLALECAELAKLLNLGALVIDEIQHWLKKRSGVDKDAMEFLTTLINEIRCAVVIIGTWEAVPILQSTLRAGRRTSSPGTTFMRQIPPGDQWDTFMRVLFRMQYLTHVVECDSNLISTFWHHTQGIHDLAVRLMAFVQCQAIADGTEKITAEMVSQCAVKHLEYVQPALRQMRQGEKDSERFIRDAEPADIEAYTKRILAEYQLCVQNRASRQAATSAGSAAAAAIATAMIHTMGMASPEQAKDFAHHEAQKDPAATAADIVGKATNAAKRPPLRPTSNPKRKAAIAKQFAALQQVDCRRVVYETREAQGDVESAFDAAGHLFCFPKWEVA